MLWALAFFFLGLGFTARVDVPLAVLAVASALAFGEMESQPWRRLWRQHAPLLLFLAVAALTTATSRDSLHSLQVQPQLLPALLCYVVIVMFATSLAARQFICMALLCSGLLTAVLMLVSASRIAADDSLAQVKMMGNALLIVPNDVLMLSVIAPLAVGVAWTGHLWLRLLAALYVVLALLAGAMVGSRQAVLVLILGLVILAAVQRPRWVIPVLLSALAAGVMVDGLMGWRLAGKIAMFPRTYVWHTAWVMFLDRPWLGQGPGMFRDLYTVFLPKAGYVLSALEDHRNMPWAHSLYLEQLAERGAGGLLVLLLLLGTALVRVRRLLLAAVAPQERSLSAGILAALLALMASGIAEASLSRLWVTVLMLLLVGLAAAGSSCTSLRHGSQNICGRVLK